MKKYIFTLLYVLLPLFTLTAQDRSQTRAKAAVDGIHEVIDRVYNYLNECTPYGLTDGQGKAVTKPASIDEGTVFSKGDFGINTYEWGVTYSGMLLASQVFSDDKYAEYAYTRMKALGEVYPYIRKGVEKGKTMRLGSLQTPRFLDDCGAMCASMIKATLLRPEDSRAFRPLLDNWFDFVINKEYRLEDRILARNRPAHNSVWLDDMYMGITPIAFRGVLAKAEGDPKADVYFREAIDQVLLFRNYLWVPEKKMYRHGWIEGMSEHPDYHWARANGWAMITMCDVLETVPPETEGWDEVLQLFRTLVSGVAAYQSPDGLWHQLINHSETYLETSASAMYVYSIAHAIRRGWIDRTAYLDVARSGWNAIARQVNDKGQVENTCVGTGLGWTNTFYANRPVSVFAAHGYGPVLLAGSELAALLAPRGIKYR